MRDDAEGVVELVRGRFHSDIRTTCGTLGVVLQALPARHEGMRTWLLHVPMESCEMRPFSELTIGLPGGGEP